MTFLHCEPHPWAIVAWSEGPASSKIFGGPRCATDELTWGWPRGILDRTAPGSEEGSARPAAFPAA